MKIKTCSIWILAIIAVAGCAANSERAIQMHRSSGKMNRDSDTGYRAVCKTLSIGGHEVPWRGALWSDKERAMRDAADHNRLHPGHTATVVH